MPKCENYSCCLISISMQGCSQKTGLVRSALEIVMILAVMFIFSTKTKNWPSVGIIASISAQHSVIYGTILGRLLLFVRFASRKVWRLFYGQSWELFLRQHRR